ncbi:MAG: hypothetical protein AB1861_08315 [Cyanobacteriota bacterium]
MQDPLSLVNKRVAAGRATGVMRSVAQARAVDNANRRTEYKGFNAARGQAIIQELGGDPLIGPQPITNGALAPGTQVALSRSGAIPAIDQMPSPRKRKKTNRPKSIFKTQFIVSLRIFDTSRKQLMAPTDSVYSQPFVVLKGIYSSKLADWELQDARINRVEFRGCGFWSSQMESANFARTIETYAASGMGGFYNSDGSYGPTEYTFTSSGTKDYTTDPPTVTETYETVPPNWSGGTGDSVWAVGEWIYKTNYKQTNPLLIGAAERTDKEVVGFGTSARTNRFSGTGNAKSFSVFRGKVSALTGQSSEVATLDGASYSGGTSGTNTETSVETKLVAGQTSILPGRKRSYADESYYKSAYVAPDTTITNLKDTDISTCLIVREDLKFAIIHRQSLTDSVNNSNDGFFLSSGKTDKKINAAPVLFTEIRSLVSLQIPEGQESVTLNIPAKMPQQDELDANSFIGQGFIVSVPLGGQFQTGYGQLTNLVLTSVEESLQLLTLTVQVNRIEVQPWNSIAEGKAYGVAHSNNNSLLQLQAIAADNITTNLKRLNFLKDNKIYIARNFSALNTLEIDSFAEVFSLEEEGALVNVVRQELLITGKIKPLTVRQNPSDPPQTFEILDISCNPKNKDYPFKVLFTGRDGTYIRLYVGGDTSPLQIGKKMLMTKYEIDKAFINNVRAIWTEENS